MGDGENLQWRVVGDDVVVLDQERREVHRLDARSAASVVDDSGVLTRRRLIAAAAAGIVVTTVALPSAAAAASNDGIFDPETDTPAATPSGVSASSGGPTSIFVSWNPMNEVSGYYVVYGISNPPTTQVAASTSALTITGLDPGQQYFVQVFAWNDASPLPAGGPRSTVVTATTDAAPAAITSESTAEVSDGTLSVSWIDGTSGTTTYTVYWRRTGTSAWSSKPNATSPTVITGLDAGFTYDYYVARIRGGLESQEPTTPAVSPVIPVPNVTGFAAGTNITDAAPGVNLKGFTWMRLKWDAVTGVSPTYQVQRFVTPNWQSVGSPTASTSAVVTGLTDNTSQQFRIRTVINGNSSSGSSSSSDSTHRVPTVTGTGNTVTQLGTSPDLVWECDLIVSGSVTTYGPDVAASYVVVGGGGGGGGGRTFNSSGTQRIGGGGGGAGAVVSGSVTLGAGTYSATVGAGGSAGIAGSSSVNGGRGGDGSSSSLDLTTTISAGGGGGGGGAAAATVANRDGNGGACGGGAGAGTTVTAAGGAGSVGSDGVGTSAVTAAAAGGAGGGAGGTPDGTPTATGRTWATADGGDGVTYGTGGAAGTGNSAGASVGANNGRGGNGGGGANAGSAGGSGIVIVRVSEYAR